jgi:hypothetical protein
MPSCLTIAQGARGGGAVQYRGTEIRPAQRDSRDNRAREPLPPAGTFLLRPLVMRISLQR